MSKPHRLFDNDLVRSLIGFRHSPRTDMAQKTINNVDFITLCMYAVGRLTCAELRCLAKARRGQSKVLDAYFGPHFGWTATDAASRQRYGGQFSSARHVKPWYRAVEHQKRLARAPMRPYSNDLTLACPPRALRAAGLGRAESLLHGVGGAL
jgi:hypothetical protein